ncbi:unnamed protein product, partial [marine sediment metagenome]
RPEFALGFGLRVNMTWKSESGNLADLTNVRWREYINYTTVGTNPPFNPNPPIPVSGAWPPEGNVMTGGIGTDTHYWLKSWVDWSTQTPGSKVAAQQYQFKDTVLNTDWTNGILGTATITREVANDPGGSYTFTTSKNGTGAFSAATIPEKP